MSLFIETIKIREGKVLNPGYHTLRFNLTRQSFFQTTPVIDLEKKITIPEECRKGIFKCRIIYGKKIESIEFEPYELKLIKSLKLVYGDEIEYNFKYKNREAILNLLSKKENNDDIIIVKNNRITDSSYSNLVFLSKGIWYTPEFPLLKGTKREKLIHESKLKVEDIYVDDLLKFEKAGLINAMIELEECLVKINQIN